MTVSQRFATVLFAATAVFAAGCASVGPRTVGRDRFDYSANIGESWKQQALLNIVKIRYLDIPIFLDVGQIVAGYTVESSATVGGSLVRGDVPDSNSASVGGGVRYTDRPTITYTPLTGDRFLRGLMAPIRPGSVFAMLQSGYQADFVLALTLDSLNGLRNPTSVSATDRRADQSDIAFLRALTLMREIQGAGVLNFRVEAGAKGEDTLLILPSRGLDPEIQAKRQELGALMGLKGTSDQYRLVYSPLPANENEIAVQTRSMLQILLALAGTVDVPAQHVAEHRAFSAPRLSSGEEMMPLLVRSGEKPPKDSYVAVKYRDHWFWIEDTDLRSKRAFALVMFLFTLADTGDKDRLPVLTIPTG